MAHVAEYKKKTVSDFVGLFNEYPIIGVVDMQNLSAKQVQQMRATLRSKAVLRMTKRRMMKIAISESTKKDADKLLPFMQGMPALIFTKENPFRIATVLRKSKSNAPIKPGQVAPKDIVVPAGPTPFSPGPIISQLAKVGIKAGIDKGKIVIKDDSVVARKGDKVSADLAGILARLKIEPMEIGLNLQAMYEKGTIFAAEVLNIDEKEYYNRIVAAVAQSRAVALEIGYATKETIPLLLTKAYRQAREVAKSGNITTQDNIAEMLAQAEAEMQAVAGAINPDEDKKQKPEPKEEKKSEEEAAAGLGSLFG